MTEKLREMFVALGIDPDTLQAEPSRTVRGGLGAQIYQAPDGVRYDVTNTSIWGLTNYSIRKLG